jgi:hypothetical protein
MGRAGPDYFQGSGCPILPTLKNPLKNPVNKPTNTMEIYGLLSWWLFTHRRRQTLEFGIAALFEFLRFA